MNTRWGNGSRLAVALAATGLAGIAPAAMATGHDPRFPRLIDARVGVVPSRSLTPAFGALVMPADRFDLARVSMRSAILPIGAFDLRILAGRTLRRASDSSALFPIDRWTARSVGIDASLPIGASLTLTADGSYTKMMRRLDVVPLDPRRVGTALTSMGIALDMPRSKRIAIDYVDVARSGNASDQARMAATLGGAPLTGHGMRFALSSGKRRQRLGWGVALSSMQRPMRDLQMGASGNIRDDATTISVGYRF